MTRRPLAFACAMCSATAVGPVYVTLPNGNVATFATAGGFVEVLDNRVIMLAETAEPASAIDVERARAAEERAKEQLAAAESPEERAAELQADYAERFANPFSAAARGYVDDVIDPRETRPRLISALDMLENKRDQNPPKKHGNIPL